MTSANLSSLDFKDIKSSFIEFLKNDPKYKDFNFDASGISTLLNIFAYNTHYIGYFVKMMLDESFVDSSKTRKALLSHAKRSSYTPKSKRAARAEVQLKIRIDKTIEPAAQFVTIPKGTSFSSVNNTDDNRFFQIVDDVTIFNKTQVGDQLEYVSSPITVFEGSIQEHKWLVQSMVSKQAFVITDKNIDIDTLRVRVFSQVNSTEYREFKSVSDVFSLTPDSEVFFVSTNEEGFYQIFFGDNVFGVQPENGNVVKAEYVSTNGETGNGAKVFSFNKPPAGGAETNIGNFNDFSVITVSNSSGGMEEEGIDSLRFNIPARNFSQNRVISETDFRFAVLSGFRSVDSLNVWGGEKNVPREYGKTFISIKPKNSDALTVSAKNELKSKLFDRKIIVGQDVVFVDPDFITADISVFVRVDFTKTTKTIGEIITLLNARVMEYNESTLNKFDTFLSDVKLMTAISGDLDYVTSAYTTKKIRKTAAVIKGSTASFVVNFSNPLMSVKSENFKYGGTDYFIGNVGDQLFIKKASTGEKAFTKSYGSVDFETGVVTFSLPAYATVNENKLEFTAVPTKPDINTSLNNIVRIGQFKVTVA